MSEDTIPTASAFADLMALLHLIADPKASQRRLDQHIAAAAQEKEERTAADRSKAALAQARAEHDAHCAERTAEADKRAALGAARIAAAEQIEARLQRIAKDVCAHDERLRLEVMHFSELMPFWNQKLQELPSWSALADEVLEKPRQPDDGGSAAGDELEAVPADNLVIGSSLTRSVRHGAAPRT